MPAIPLPAEQLALLGELPLIKLPRGATLLRQGELPDAVWWLESGLLRYFHLSEHGQEANLRFCSEGHWVAAGWPPAPSRQGIASLEACTLRRLPITRLHALLTEQAALQTLLLQQLACQLSRQESRETSLLQASPAERYQAFLQDHHGLAQRVPLRQIASWLGITDVALSRIRRRMDIKMQIKSTS